MAETSDRGLVTQLRSFPQAFWMLNIMETLERAAYYGVRTVIPIYIAQADEINGLHFTQIDKGIIFFWWALVQSLSPMFAGGFADRYGYKRIIASAFTSSIIGYILMATQREFYPFLFGCGMVALGTAIFRPGIQGTLVQTMTNKTSSVGWGMFYMVVNVGGFFGPPLAHFWRGISWPTVFFSSAGILALNYLTLLTYKQPPFVGERRGGPIQVLKFTLKNIIRPKLFLFILIMSGFWLMFMQLFDMLPNFIVDWVDSSMVVGALHLPSFMTVQTPRGMQIAQEWMINMNSGFIVLFVVFVSWLVSRMRRLSSILIGITISSVGLVLAGFTTAGYFCIMGIVCFSIGEMLASPKMNEYLGVIAPEGQKGLYMGYAYIPQAIGWGYGSIMGGQLYDKMGDKANLALHYFANHLGITSGIGRTEAVAKLQEHLRIDAAQVTKLLWDTYDPWKLWLPFAAIGILAAIAMFFYGRAARKWEAPGT